MPSYKLVVSDVDGTLVQPDKSLAPSTIHAVKRLREAGIGFTVTSSRPPVGFKMLVEPLGLTLPMGAFNGSTLVGPDLDSVEEHVLTEQAARTAVDALRRHGAGVWVFARGDWLVTDPQGDYVDRETHTLQRGPTVVDDFAPFLADVGKIVGASHDHEALAQCEAELQGSLKGQAGAVRSQPYYLDITPPGFDKGTFVVDMAKRLGIEPADILTIGDMDNDVAMFRASGFSVAMGNGSDAAKAAAKGTTTANTEDGFANAMQRYILG